MKGLRVSLHALSPPASTTRSKLLISRWKVEIIIHVTLLVKWSRKPGQANQQASQLCKVKLKGKFVENSLGKLWTWSVNYFEIHPFTSFREHFSVFLLCTFTLRVIIMGGL